MLVYNKLALSLGTETDERGFVKTNNKGESSIEDLYVAGDLRANTKKQIYTAWDTAVDALDDINGKIRNSKREQVLKTI
jgi:thioredoxin reductase (NADPH)